MITLIDTAVTQQSQESVLFQASIESLPPCATCMDHHSWHVSLENLEKQWRMFLRQMERTQQLLNSIQQKHLAPTHMISTQQAELTNLESIYTSYRPCILAASQLLRRDPSFNRGSPLNRHTRRSLLPFLGDALSWLMGKATTKDVSSIKKSQPTDCNTTQTNKQN